MQQYWDQRSSPYIGEDTGYSTSINMQAKTPFDTRGQGYNSTPSPFAAGLSDNPPGHSTLETTGLQTEINGGNIEASLVQNVQCMAVLDHVSPMCDTSTQSDSVQQSNVSCQANPECKKRKTQTRTRTWDMRTQTMKEVNYGQASQTEYLGVTKGTLVKPCIQKDKSIATNDIFRESRYVQSFISPTKDKASQSSVNLACLSDIIVQTTPTPQANAIVQTDTANIGHIGHDWWPAFYKDLQQSPPKQPQRVETYEERKRRLIRQLKLKSMDSSVT